MTGREISIGSLIVLPSLAAILVGCGGDRDRPREPSPAPLERHAPAASAGEPEWFVDHAAASGLDFVHVNGASGRFYQPEISGSGAALFDYDNDGDLDIWLVQGGSLDRPRRRRLPAAVCTATTSRSVRTGRARCGSPT